MKDKTICFISPKFSDFIGGMETHAIEFVNFFSGKRGYKIRSVFTRKVVDDGVPAPHKELNFKLAKLIKPVLEGNFESDAEKILEQSNPLNDIYYLNSPTWLPALVILKKRYPSMRIMVRSGGNDLVAGWVGSEVDSKKSLEESREYIVSLINLYVEKLIVNSDYSFKRTISIGVKPEKVVKIIGGVDCNKFKPSTKDLNLNKDKFELVTAARLVKFKGFEYTLKAVKESIEKSSLDISYTIVGDGPEKENINKIIENLGMLDKVKLIGSVSLEDVPKYLAEKDIFLHLPIYFEKKERGSSYVHTETMGRCLCEAAACGLPVVASDVGGISEIVIDKVTGFIVREKDYFTAAKKIILLINDSNLRSKMSKNARKRAENFFDFEKVFGIYEKLF